MVKGSEEIQGEMQNAEKSLAHHPQSSSSMDMNLNCKIINNTIFPCIYKHLLVFEDYNTIIHLCIPLLNFK